MQQQRKRGPGGRPPSTWFGHVLVRDPDEAKEIFRRSIKRFGARHELVAQDFGFSVHYVKKLVQRFGLVEETREIRRALRNRFRLRAA